MPEQDTDFTKLGGRTAIARRAVSVPTRELIAGGRIPKGASVFNHGRGKAQADADALADAAGSYAEHDPNHMPNPEAMDQTYDVVISNYVMNVIPPDIRDGAWKDVARATGGVAYVTVRSTGDKSITKGAKERYKDGVIMSTGTFQKPYTAEGLVEEAKQYFKNAEIIMGKKGGISWTVACSEPKYTQNHHAAAQSQAGDPEATARQLATQQDQQGDDAALQQEIADLQRRAGIEKPVTQSV